MRNSRKKRVRRSDKPAVLKVALAWISAEVVFRPLSLRFSSTLAAAFHLAFQARAEPVPRVLTGVD